MNKRELERQKVIERLTARGEMSWQRDQAAGIVKPEPKAEPFVEDGSTIPDEEMD